MRPFLRMVGEVSPWLQPRPTLIVMPDSVPASPLTRPSRGFRAPPLRGHPATPRIVTLVELVLSVVEDF